MSFSLLQNIAQTPWWFYFFLYYLYYIGYTATKPQKAAVRPTFIFSLMSITTLFLSLALYIPFNLQIIVILLGTVGLGSFIGWLHYHFRQIKIVDNVIYLPGTWLILIFCTLSLITKYYFYGSQISFDPEWLKNLEYARYFTALEGTCIGLFIGRMFYVLRNGGKIGNHRLKPLKML